MAPCGHIEDVPKEPEKDSNDDNPDRIPDPDPDPDSDPEPDPNPDPEPKSNPKPERNEGNLSKSLSKAIKSRARSIHKDPSKKKAKIRDPNMFDGSNLKNIRGFLLQCKLNFRSKPKSFQTEQLKVNYSLSF